MNFSSWHDFIAMGRYGHYIWPAYGISLAILSTHLIAAIRYYRRTKNHVTRHKHAPHT